MYLRGSPSISEISTPSSGRKRRNSEEIGKSRHQGRQLTATGQSVEMCAPVLPALMGNNNNNNNFVILPMYTHLQVSAISGRLLALLALGLTPQLTRRMATSRIMNMIMIPNTYKAKMNKNAKQLARISLHYMYCK